MFANFNHFSIAVAVCMALLGCTGQDDPDIGVISAMAATEIPEQQRVDSRCDVSGNCQTRLDDVPRAVEICDGMSPSLFWNSNQRNLLLACECNCTSHDNKGWFIFANQKEVQGIGLGKSVTPESLQDVDRVPDIMASHPLCRDVDHEDLRSADFVTLIKYPTGNDDSPYCFEARSIREAGGGVRIVEGSRVIDASDDESFLETSAESKSDILDLAQSAFHRP